MPDFDNPFLIKLIVIQQVCPSAIITGKWTLALNRQPLHIQLSCQVCKHILCLYRHSSWVFGVLVPACLGCEHLNTFNLQTLLKLSSAEKSGHAQQKTNLTSLTAVYMHCRLHVRSIHYLTDTQACMYAQDCSVNINNLKVTS